MDTTNIISQWIAYFFEAELTRLRPGRGQLVKAEAKIFTSRPVWSRGQSDHHWRKVTEHDTCDPLLRVSPQNITVWTSIRFAAFWTAFAIGPCRKTPRARKILFSKCGPKVSGDLFGQHCHSVNKSLLAGLVGPPYSALQFESCVGKFAESESSSKGV